MTSRPLRVLIIEQAVSFGGSFVVAASFLRHVDPELVEATFVTAMERDFLDYRLVTNARVIRDKHLLDYRRVGNLKQRLAVLRLPRRLTSYLVTVCAGILNLPYSLRMLSKIIINRYDIIHINNGTEHMESNLFLWLFSYKCVAHVHGHGTVGNLERAFMNRCGQIIAVSNSVSQTLAKNGISENKITVIENPTEIPEIDRERARRCIAERHNLPEHAKFIAIPGRLVEWKGQHHFLHAIALMLRHNPDIYGFLIGDTADGERSYMKDLIRTSEKLNIEHNLIFTGYVDDVNIYYQAMDVVYHCSTADEPFGLIITESMACATPVIASDRGAPLQIVEDGVTGFLVNPEDHETLAKRGLTLLNDEKMRKNFGFAARNTAKTRYNVNAYTQKIIDAYKSLAL